MGGGNGDTLDAALTAIARQLSERAADYDRTAAFPFENFPLLQAAGLMALPVSREFGGGGAGLVEASRVVRAIARGDASTALVLAMHYIQHGCQFRARVWPREAYARIARDAVENGALINSLQVEPGGGALARGGLPTTVAEPVPGGFRINGRKTCATGIPILRWLSVWARTPGPSPRVGVWLVPRGAAGVDVVETWDHIGMRASGSHDVVLRDVFVPEAHLLDCRPAGGSVGQHPAAAAWVAVLLSSVYLGVAEAARDWLVGWLRECAPCSLGHPLSDLQRSQDAVGRIEALLYAADRVLLGAAAESDANLERPGEIASGFVKVTVTASAIRAVECAMSLAGNAGLSRRNPLERHLRDALCGRAQWPQDDHVFRRSGQQVLQGGA